ncbi:MAG: DUF4097 domain-containing protein [Gemmatimonadota bacterium]|nr:DUF4097 domain-containing protein [Gemmatimonadota bacterium]
MRYVNASTGLVVAHAMLLLGALGAAGPVGAQERERTPEEWLRRCREWRDDGDRVRHCQVRDVTIPRVSGRLSVDGRQNGGIAVRGWDRNEILVRAKIQTWAESDAEARRLAAGIRVRTDEGRIAAEESASGRRSGWSVSYDVYVPRQSDLDLTTHNGGISVEGVQGRIAVEALNGGVSIRNVRGELRGGTTNGGVMLALDGDRWVGDGVDLETTNGGVTIVVPERYNARLETGTVNGGMRVEFPITVQGMVGRRLTTTLGAGGPLIRVRTTNGGVTLKRG